MKNALMLFIFAALFAGCASKEKIIYKEIKIPIKCSYEMPIKPKNNGGFESAKELFIYFLKCEEGLKYCTGVSK